MSEDVPENVDAFPQQPAGINQLFFNSIANRVDRLPELEQSRLQMEVLQLVHKFEFGEEYL